MANTIKLKRGSGSDPQASDLVVGELAIRTDSGKIFTKKDNGSVAEISGGGGIDDGDKGDITVSNGGDTFTIDSGVVTSAKIADGTIVNADINASAAIAGSKISPNFGSQDITTTGDLNCSDITLSDAHPVITFTDTDNNPDFRIKGNSGAIEIEDITNNRASLTVYNDNHIDIHGNLDVGSGLDVTGDMTITNNIPKISLIDTDNDDDFEIKNQNGVFTVRDATNSADRLTIASDGTTNIADNLVVGNFLRSTNGYAVGSTTVISQSRELQNITLNSSSVTATTQSAGNNTTRVATTAFVTTAISNLVDSAPSTLDTLNELAAALGDDANFSTTVTNSIATKLPLAGGTLTGNVIHNDNVKALFGTGSDLEIYHNGSDSYIDNHQGDLYIRGQDDNIILQAVDGENAVKCNPNSSVHLYHNGSDKFNTSSTGVSVTGSIVVSGTVDGRDVASDGTKLDGIESNATADQSASEILTLIKTVDGAGSGLDADLLDGLSSESFVRSDAADTISGDITFTDGGQYPVVIGAASGMDDGKLLLRGSSNPYIRFREGNTDKAFIQWNASGYVDICNQESSERLKIGSGSNGLTFTEGGSERTVYHTGNLSVGDSGLTQNNFTNALKSKLDGIASGATNVTNTNQLTNGAGFITATLTNEQVQDIVGGMVSSNTESGITVTYQDSDGTLDFSVASQTDNNFTNADHSKLDGIESGATADQTASEILTLIKTVDGSGSGLDADLLDGANASVSASNNTIVKRHSSGYIFANYFNTTPNDVSSGVTKVCVETGNDGYIRHGTAAAIRAFINVADGANNITNNNQLTNGAGYITSSNSAITNKLPLAGGTMTGELQINARLDVGNGNGSDHEIRIFKEDNNVSDHIQFYNGTTRVGEIGCEDTTWLRINQETAKNIYTPRYIRADAGFFVDGTSKGINGSGNFIGGTIAGASDYGTLLRSNANDTASGIITLSNSSRDTLNFSANSTDDNRGLAFNGRIAISADYNDGYLRLNNASEFSNGIYTPGVIRADNGFVVDSTTVINGSAQLIASRLTGALPAIDGSALTGLSAGATGGGSDEVFWCNGQTVTSNFTIPNNKNAMSAGPITINSGVTVTVGSGETWTIV